ncbi:MAG: hypothetical protein WCI03_12180 [bacterium]
MADQNKVTQLTNSISAVLNFKNKSLISRPEWGTMSFRNAEPDIARVMTTLDMLKDLPLDYLTDSACDRIRGSIDKFPSILQRLDQFSIEQNSASSARDEITRHVHEASDPFFEAAAPWIPFLAYKKGDIAENISRLSAAVEQGGGILENAKAYAKGKAKEIDDITIKAREASAAAGAAVFTQDFNNESDKLEQRALPWLKWGIVCGIATLIAAVLSWFWTQDKLDNGQIIQKIASKVIALSVLATATIWCGRMYKALRHQAVTNRHRALALQTFQAFSAAATDNQTKNAVLLEATRSIFALQSTGLVDPSAEESSTSIIEIAKAAASKD